MYKGISHTHLAVVLLFLVLYTVKLFLLITNKTAALEALRAKTKVADMILGTLIVGTGSYLAFAHPQLPVAYIVKIIGVILSIPLGIIAMKKSNKALALVVFVLFLYLYGVAETKSLTFSKENKIITTLDVERGDAVQGKTLYENLCVSCHGIDGKLGAGGAYDLSASILKRADIAHVIANGRGSMVGFSNQLKATDIASIAAYVETLRK